MVIVLGSTADPLCVVSSKMLPSITCSNAVTARQTASRSRVNESPLLSIIEGVVTYLSRRPCGPARLALLAARSLKCRSTMSLAAGPPGRNHSGAESPGCRQGRAGRRGPQAERSEAEDRSRPAARPCRTGRGAPPARAAPTRRSGDGPDAGPASGRAGRRSRPGPQAPMRAGPPSGATPHRVRSAAGASRPRADFAHRAEPAYGGLRAGALVGLRCACGDEVRVRHAEAPTRPPARPTPDRAGLMADSCSGNSRAPPGEPPRTCRYRIGAQRRRRAAP
jgi:hypothetical protein